MNFDWVNLEPKDWTKEIWQERYAEYCKTNMFGTKTKKEYYEMVMENYRKMEEREKPISQDLLDEWSRGRRAAKTWAREHGCDINGCSIKDSIKKTNDIDAKDIAEKAEFIAIETSQKLDYLIDVAKQRRA